MANRINSGSKVIWEGDLEIKSGVLYKYGGESSSGGSGLSLFRSFKEVVHVLVEGEAFPISLPINCIRKDTPENREKMQKEMKIRNQLRAARRAGDWDTYERILAEH